MAIMPVNGGESWRDGFGVRPVTRASAAPPPARSAPGRSTADEPIDVEVLWEELEAALRSTPAQPDITALTLPPAVVRAAYAAAMRRPPRGPLVDLAV